MQKRIFFVTLGCKVNQYETGAFMEMFRRYGFDKAEENESCDAVIINTCAVTSESERKSRQIIRKMRKMNPKTLLAVTGCFAQNDPEAVSRLDGVDIICGTARREDFVKEVVAALKKREITEQEEEIHENVESKHEPQYNPKRETVEDINTLHHKDAVHMRTILKKQEVFEEFHVVSRTERTRAFVKIQDGCNRYCSYCIIPYLRGSIKSRELKNILEEVTLLVADGYMEIVLTGIHISSYGLEKSDGMQLGELIAAVSKIEGIRRLRLGSLEPTIVTHEFIAYLKSCSDVICPHFHLSLQSGSAAVLRRMNRKYSPDAYRLAIHRIRQAFPDAALTTDIIVGFPGETEDEFTQTTEFCKEMNFAKIHVFKFSPRRGTAAASFDGQIDTNIKEERSKRLISLSDEMAQSFHQRFIGKKVLVLVEKTRLDINDYEGMTANYIKVHVRHAEAKSDFEHLNDMCDSIQAETLVGTERCVRIERADSSGCFGIEID